ncbi:DUF2029 domain-containing protein [Corynebacterium lizhenjunii]|uniref:DUF2029 domain-containing protein n=1 Tax=Corynebacterium lizhenjunii TaxID=2709394 RepID=A0A7T0KE24_9CORY|nr:glycosyltransferase 87 family protein [Corynebacterium lizhenjunii]QPK79070.1 DUF2029 domain-containing protein [Corynebacterium lizhenjunii]
MSISGLEREPLARGVVEFFGGPRGVHARGPVPVLRWVLSVGWVFLGFAFLAKANCSGGRRLEDGSIGLNWAGSRQYTSFCYNDIVPLYGARGLDQPGFVYAYSWVEDGTTRYMEYPVLTGLFQGLMGWIARSTYGAVEWLGVPEAGWYFTLTALAMSLMWVATLFMLSQLLGTRQWDGLVVAASPLVVMHGFTNWDIPSIMLAVAALVAVSHGHSVTGGVCIGLGAALKLWPVFLLGAFFVLAARNRRWKQFGALVAGAGASWAIVNAPLAWAYPEAWGEFFRLNSTRSWEWTTIYAVAGREFGFSASPEAINIFSLVSFALACAAIALFGLRVQRTPRVAELVYLILVAFLMLNKVWSPQYSLWLLVPAVLALPHWRLLFSWAVADALLWPILMWHMHGVDNKGVPGGLLDIAVLTRDGFILAIALLIIMQMLGKLPDKVLAANGYDILAGDFRK